MSDSKSNVPVVIIVVIAALLVVPCLLGVLLLGGLFMFRSVSAPGGAATASSNRPAQSMELAPASASGATLSGKIVGVADGDSLTILSSENELIKARLQGIDAPEGGQEYGDQSKQALTDKVLGQQVRYANVGEDKYGRTLAHVYLGEQWINEELIADGAAWHLTEFSSDPRLAAAEQQAKGAGRGLWSLPNPVAPWEYRLPQTGAIDTVYVTTGGSRYHRPNCPHLAKSKIPLPIATARGKYEPCSTCNPPK